MRNAGADVVLDLQPSLSGERTRLRPLEVSDFENLCAVALDPLRRSFWRKLPQV